MKNKIQLEFKVTAFDSFALSGFIIYEQNSSLLFFLLPTMYLKSYRTSGPPLKGLLTSVMSEGSMALNVISTWTFFIFFISWSYFIISTFAQSLVWFDFVSNFQISCVVFFYPFQSWQLSTFRVGCICCGNCSLLNVFLYKCQGAVVSKKSQTCDTQGSRSDLQLCKCKHN